MQIYICPIFTGLVTYFILYVTIPLDLWLFNSTKMCLLFRQYMLNDLPAYYSPNYAGIIGTSLVLEFWNTLVLVALCN